MRPAPPDRLPLHRPHVHLASPFGSDWFGRRAEAFARAFGSPVFLISQTVLVALWIAANAVWVALRWDPYPFILLNLAFSLQAAYAAPLILLAQTRQADRDKAYAIADDKQRDAIARESLARQDALSAQIEQLEALIRELHGGALEARR